mmetsp:Transcript_4473/g.6670  ORF Transcript_4473/g.6670 Transcript_4473/m.6670 type:complete len:316 (+) Transcript_4473:2390-3337(+)
MSFIVFSFCRSLVMFKLMGSNSEAMHQIIIRKVLRSKIVFFDSNPAGRILTRFSKDFAVLDIILPSTTFFMTFGLFRAISVEISVLFVSHWIFWISIVIGYLMYRQIKTMLKPLNETQRLDAVSRGPIHSSFTNTVNGLVSIRTLERFPYFQAKAFDALEKCCNLTFMFYTYHRSVALRLEMLAVIVLVCVTWFTILSKGEIENEYLSFILQSVTDVNVYFSVSIRMIAEIANYLTSAQRIEQYIELPSEGDLDLPSDSKLDKVWPSNGDIEFSGVTMRYRETLEPSLKNLSFRVQPKMKVGIVGRTGAGKSSIL